MIRSRFAAALVLPLIASACASAPAPEPEQAAEPLSGLAETLQRLIDEALAAQPSLLPRDAALSVLEAQPTAGKLIVQAQMESPPTFGRPRQSYMVIAPCEPPDDLPACSAKVIEAARTAR